MAESNFRGVLGAEPLGEWGMAKTRAAEPRGKAFPLNFIRAEKTGNFEIGGRGGCSENLKAI